MKSGALRRRVWDHVHINTPVIKEPAAAKFRMVGKAEAASNNRRQFEIGVYRCNTPISRRRLILLLGGDTAQEYQ